MLEVVTETRIFSFDGRVLEVFEVDGDSKRFHLTFVQAVAIEEKRRGHRFAMSYSPFDRPMIYDVADAQLPQMQQLVAAVHEARNAAT